MKASEVRAMSVAELNTKLDALKKDLFMLRMQHATNQLDNPQKLVQTKRDIARQEDRRPHLQAEGSR